MRAVKEEGGSKEEVDSAVARVREVYERAVAQVPPGEAKRHWRRYIFLWLNYALFEEIETKVCYVPLYKRLVMILKFSWVLSVPRIMTVQDKYTQLQFKSYLTSSSRLQSFG